MSENGSKNGGGTTNDNHDKHKKLYHWVYVAGFSILTGVVDFIFLWPENHFAALLVIAAALSLVVIYELTIRGVSHYLVVAAVIGLFILAGVANLAIKTPLAADRPRLSIANVYFLRNAPLQAGPLLLEWQVINSGKTDAIILEEKSTPVLIAGSRQLPETPIFMNAKSTLQGKHIIPGMPLYGVTQTIMTLSQAQVDAIKNGSAYLFYYGYIKYDGGKFSFITVYNPTLSLFVNADSEFPAYSRAE